MRVTVDTNIVVSAFLWGGNPARVLEAARDGLIDIYSTPTLVAEIREVLSREKFEQRLLAVGSSVRAIIDEYKALCTLKRAIEIEPVVERDPDDDAVLACAISAGCELIVSGDRDLLDLKEYRSIRIVTATELLAELNL